MARKYQVVTLKVFFDDECESPQDWRWPYVIDGEAELLGYEPPVEVACEEEDG